MVQWKTKKASTLSLFELFIAGSNHSRINVSGQIPGSQGWSWLWLHGSGSISLFRDINKYVSWCVMGKSTTAASWLHSSEQGAGSTALEQKGSSVCCRHTSLDSDANSLIYADKHTCTQTNTLGFHPSVWMSGLIEKDDIFLLHTRSHLHKTMLKILCKGSSQVHWIGNSRIKTAYSFWYSSKN